MPFGLRHVEELGALDGVGILRRDVAARIAEVLEDRRFENRVHELRRVGKQAVAVDETRSAVGVAQVERDGNDRGLEGGCLLLVRDPAHHVVPPGGLRVVVHIDALCLERVGPVRKRVDVRDALLALPVIELLLVLLHVLGVPGMRLRIGQGRGGDLVGFHRERVGCGEDTEEERCREEQAAERHLGRSPCRQASPLRRNRAARPWCGE